MQRVVIILETHWTSGASLYLAVAGLVAEHVPTTCNTIFKFGCLFDFHSFLFWTLWLGQNILEYASKKKNSVVRDFVYI